PPPRRQRAGRPGDRAPGRLDDRRPSRARVTGRPVPQPRDHSDRTAMSAHDPITLQIVGRALCSISDEMNVALVRTSYSTNIKDRGGCPAGSPLVAHASFGTPLHLGVFPYAVRALLAAIPAADMRPDDDYICNLPYPAGPGHLNDAAAAPPVFGEGELVAVVGCTAHHVDVGGGAPGSMPFGV